MKEDLSFQWVVMTTVIQFLYMFSLLDKTFLVMLQ